MLFMSFDLSHVRSLASHLFRFPSFRPLHHLPMALVPFHEVSLQHLLRPLIRAEQNLQLLYQCLYSLQDIEDFLEDVATADALDFVNMAIRFVNRAIRAVTFYKLHMCIQLQNQLCLHWHHFRRVPPLDLEL